MYPKNYYDEIAFHDVYRPDNIHHTTCSVFIQTIADFIFRAKLKRIEAFLTRFMKSVSILIIGDSFYQS